MEPIYAQNFTINDAAVDCYGRIRPSMMLFYIQEVAGRHCDLLALDYNSLAKRHLFWAVTRHRLQITRLPMSGETIRVETWPMPTTKVAYPRSVVAYDESGEEVFRAISLWVLMDLDTRAMVLPRASGIIVEGTLRGTELALPGAVIPKTFGLSGTRTVCFTDLDRNGHMNNTRYLDWAYDLLPSSFHREHTLREMTVSYSAEAREGQVLTENCATLEDGIVQVDLQREDAPGKPERVFSARLRFD